MLKTIANRYAKRAAARRRTIRRRAAAWKQRARRALTLMAVAGGMLGGSASIAHAQIGGMGGMGAAGGFGQAAMAPTGGLVNRAVTRLQDLEANGPGWLYYGLNAADRGLGYNGSYMTLGGFIPYAEDDLGGLWSADLRSHLSEYGGFFSNVGFVRKQFLGGTILGVGVYWDYDGDQNQYPLRGNPCGTGVFGQFGHSYNQVGISAEWLTDYGNIRSNGYIPVGTTAYTAGAPGSPFFQNFVMCQYGYDAALSGADLEVGAYIPGLSDWAGMISVGGYALGNERYNWDLGPKRGQDVVPFFGGVYTRLDLTLVRNWDFSLQANNDSYFDWTGFARLTYRMGGSRRRNVPDQMEQPMMRNEHIVRAHQTPEVALNPVTNLPWRVIHVNNAFAGTGTGSATAPFTTIEAGNAAATNPYDIVLVDRGNATYNQTTPFSPLAANQYFIGNGTPFYLPNVCCDPINLATTSGPRPTLTNPTGASVNLTNGLAVNNFNITGSQVGILGTGNLSSGLARPGLPVPFAPPSYGSATGDAFVNNVTISGTKVANQTGVFLDKTTGTADFQNTIVQNMTKAGFAVNGGDPNVNFHGQILNSSTANGGFTSPVVDIANTTGGTINLAVGTPPPGSTVTPNLISDDGGGGVKIATSAGDVNIGNAKLTNTVPTALAVTDSSGTITVTDSEIDKNTAGAAVRVDGGNAVVSYAGKIKNSAGNILKVDGTTGGSVTLTSPAGSPFTETGDGILVQNSVGDVTVLGANINSQQEGILVQNSSGKNTFNDITITGAVNAGVSLQQNTGSESFNNLQITTNNATGFLGLNNSDVNVTGNSAVNSTGGAAVSLVNTIVPAVNANLNFTSLTSTNSPSNGVLLDNVTGIFNTNTVTVTNSQASGFVVRDSEGLDVNVGVITAVSTGTSAGANGIEVTNVNTASPESVNFGKVNVTTQNGTGLLTNNTGLVTATGGTIAATGGAAISATDSNLGVVLTSASSTNSTGNGIDLVRDKGSVEIGQTTITNATGVGINAVNNVPGFKADFGVTKINGTGSEGVNIANTTDPVPDTTFNFKSLAITTTTAGAAGFRTRNGGTVNFDSPATVTVTGGAAVDMENTTGTTNGVAGSGFTFDSLTSNNSASNGVRLVNLNSDFRVLNQTTINAAGGDSVLITDNQAIPQEYNIRFNTIDINARRDVGLQVDGIAGQVIIDNLLIDNTAGIAGDAVRVEGTSDRGATGGRVYIQSGVIQGTQGNGVFAQNSILSLDSVTIQGSTANAVLAYAAANDITTISIVDSSLTTTSIHGVRLEALGTALGTGEINATILRNQIDVTGNCIDAVVTNAFGQISLNAQSNYGTLAPYAPAPGAGGINLDNSLGGSLGIFQGNTAALSVSNNGVTVTSAGVITPNTPVPTPPPPTP